MRRDELLTALAALAGSPRTLIYDLTEEEAPSRSNPSTPFVRGSDAWWRFVEHRRALDDGEGLNLLISLRGLRSEERLLAVNWGTAFANSFLLIEPADPWLDLSTNEGLRDYVSRTGSRSAPELLRCAYAEWNYWTRDESGELESHGTTLALEPDKTFWRVISERLPQTFPAAAFLSSLTLLNLRESELFTGGKPVAQSVMPFLTRLGLPIVYDPRHVLHSARQLVNAGLAGAQDPDDGWRTYRGPSQPLPADIGDERFGRMIR